MPHASEIPCNDELKVYRVEGVGEEEERSSAENLKDVKTSLVTEEEEKNATNFSSSTKSPRPSAEQSGPASQHGKPFEHQHFLPPTPYGYMVAPIPHPNGPYSAISMKVVMKPNRIFFFANKHPKIMALGKITLVKSGVLTGLGAPSALRGPSGFGRCVTAGDAPS
ncbi:CTNNB1_binding domain-containing protein [Trichonephila clavata]|uniref:CTNNB1_binding domain-containing protein n=1 Tax=Trichonephila clavata TaxID=2740835 RepID=A0A8X6F3J8_TRICU|nr:CTNNB1_binding domain-containing protein [Trichonephila clavata]